MFLWHLLYIITHWRIIQPKSTIGWSHATSPPSNLQQVCRENQKQTFRHHMSHFKETLPEPNRSSCFNFKRLRSINWMSLVWHLGASHTRNLPLKQISVNVWTQSFAKSSQRSVVESSAGRVPTLRMAQPLLLTALHSSFGVPLASRLQYPVP